MQDGIVLEMRGICKYFPGVRALQNVDFTLREGEIHALMGENGAGKSTLIKVLTGVYPKDGGEVHIKGVEGAAVIRSPQDAQNAGISTVYQEITLCPNLTVAARSWNPWAYPPAPSSSWAPAPSPCSRWWPSPGRWIWSARCLSWTNPPPPWTTRRCRSSSASCGTCGPRAWASFSSPTSWSRSMRSATGSPC